MKIRFGSGAIKPMSRRKNPKKLVLNSQTRTPLEMIYMEKWPEELRREDGITATGLTRSCCVRLNRASQIRLPRHPFVRIFRGGQALSLPPKQLVLRKFRYRSSAEEEFSDPK
ncbi:hypothetical protein U1Q18_044642 [Sarracenia purpurea var. burkii]